MNTATKKVRPTSDAKWGYKFGADGLMSGEEAETFLGGISRRTLYRMVDAGKIRKGRLTGKIVLCRRSVVQYASGREE